MQFVGNVSSESISRFESIGLPATSGIANVDQHRSPDVQTNELTKAWHMVRCGPNPISKFWSWLAGTRQMYLSFNFRAPATLVQDGTRLRPSFSTRSILPGSSGFHDYMAKSLATSLYSHL